MVFGWDSASIPIINSSLFPIFCPLRYQSDSIDIGKLRGTIGY